MQFKKPRFWDKNKMTLQSILLYPISLLIIFLINVKKLKKKTSFKIPIICVGNFYLGGTGKTPVSIEIHKILKACKKKPAFIKKYYSYLYDEIALLKKRGTVFSSTSRKNSINELIRNNYNVAILDDGYQEYSIKKDLKIICFNEKEWIGNGMVIPAGPLREPIGNISDIDVIVIKGKKNKKIEKYLYELNPNLKIFYCNYSLIIKEKFYKKKIIAFTGIGNPNGFFNLLIENNLNIIKKISFPDHKIYKDKEIKSLLNLAKINNAILLTTEKDYIKIHDEFKRKVFQVKINVIIKKRDKLEKIIKNCL